MIKDSDMEAGSLILETSGENCHSLIVAQVVFRSSLLSNPEGLNMWPQELSSSITRELVSNVN